MREVADGFDPVCLAFVVRIWMGGVLFVDWAGTVLAMVKGAEENDGYACKLVFGGGGGALKRTE